MGKQNVSEFEKYANIYAKNRMDRKLYETFEHKNLSPRALKMLRTLCNEANGSESEHFTPSDNLMNEFGISGKECFLAHDSSKNQTGDAGFVIAEDGIWFRTPSHLPFQKSNVTFVPFYQIADAEEFIYDQSKSIASLKLYCEHSPSVEDIKKYKIGKDNAITVDVAYFPAKAAECLETKILCLLLLRIVTVCWVDLHYPREQMEPFWNRDVRDILKFF